MRSEGGPHTAAAAACANAHLFLLLLELLGVKHEPEDGDDAEEAHHEHRQLARMPARLAREDMLRVAYDASLELNLVETSSGDPPGTGDL